MNQRIPSFFLVHSVFAITLIFLHTPSATPSSPFQTITNSINNHHEVAYTIHYRDCHKAASTREIDQGSCMQLSDLCFIGDQGAAKRTRIISPSLIQADLGRSQQRQGRILQCISFEVT
jgi:hypothetical protein